MVGLTVRANVLQAYEGLTLLGLPDDRAEILEILVRNVGHHLNVRVSVSLSCGSMLDSLKLLLLHL